MFAMQRYATSIFVDWSHFVLYFYKAHFHTAKSHLYVYILAFGMRTTITLIEVRLFGPYYATYQRYARVRDFIPEYTRQFTEDYLYPRLPELSVQSFPTFIRS